MRIFKTPPDILDKIQQCAEKQDKSLDLTNHGDLYLPIIPPEVYQLSHLEQLILTNNAIQIVPDEIQQLTHLKRLDLRGNPLRQVADVSGLIVHYADFKKLDLPPENIVGLKLTLFSYDAPDGIFDFPHLELLDISNHRLDSIPDWVLKLKNLSRLNLSRNRLQSVEGLEQLEHLSCLDLGRNRLQSVKELGQLKHLSRLDLRNNLLQSIEGLEQLKYLSHLYLRNSELQSVEGLEQLKHLSYLDLRNNLLQSVEGLGQLENLSYLDLSFNQLKSVEGLRTLENLSSLDLKNNSLQSVEGLGQLKNLSRLDLSSNSLQSVEGLGQLEHLSRLDLGSNSLQSVEELEQLENLNSLDLSDNLLQSVEGLGQLENLSSLDLSDNSLKSVEELGQLENLSSLYLSSNLLQSTKGLGQLKHLGNLYLSFNQLKSAKGLGQLQNLSNLDLSNNSLQSMEGLGQLQNLSNLDLSDNSLQSVEGLGQLQNLSSLYLSDNKLQSVEGLGQLQNLSSLDLRNNLLQSVEGLTQLECLSSLYLSFNSLKSVEGLEQLQNLSRLYLRNSELQSAEGLGQLQNLSHLDLRSNSLQSVEGLGQLENLSSLDLRNNKLQSVEGLGQLANLSSLYLSFNQLESVEGLGQLESLSSLYLRNNLLQSLPEELFLLPKLECLDIEDNKITEPSIEQLEPDDKWGYVHLLRVRNYLHQLKLEQTDYLYEAKLLIVGEGGAGKTTLANKIQNPDYQLQAIKSTEGIDVIPWSFPYNEQQDYQVNIWDFGGQEIYHATHQFFLSKRALYILVTDSRKEDTNFYYWLNIVELLGEDSPVFIVKNERDNCQQKIDEPSLRCTFQYLKEIYATNLKLNNKDFDKLLIDLPHRLKQLPHIGTPVPKSWKTIRDILQDDERNHIDLKEFLTLCDQHGFKHKQDKLQLSETLHDLGSVLHFQHDPLLQKTIFLKPQWVTQTIYRVLKNSTVEQQFGKFTKADLKTIWHQSEYDFMHDDLLQLMLKFKLCYPLKYCENTYIAPQLLAEQKPDYKWNSKNNVTVLYQNYAFMPKGIITQLIVTLHEDIADQQQCVWRTGVVFEKDQTHAEVIESYGKRKISIKVEGQHCRDLMTIVNYELQKIHNSYKKPLDYEVSVPCNCEEPEYFKFDTLKEYAGVQADFRCPKLSCRKDFSAHQLLDGIFDLRKLEEKERKTINYNYGGNHYDSSLHARDIKDSNTNTGDNVTQTFNQGIQIDLQTLIDVILTLDLGENQKKVIKLLNEAKEEINTPNPDKEDIGSALDRVIKLVNKTGQLADSVKQQLIPVAQNIGQWLGEHGDTIKQFFTNT